MGTETLIALLGFFATLLLVCTGLLNYSVFIRQLRYAREQLETARRQLESAQQQPEIQMIQRAMADTSDHLRIFVERPYLRAYFYENKQWSRADQASLDEVKAMAELLLNIFASSIIHSAAFPQYPLGSVEQTIQFHLRHSTVLKEYLLENFDRFPLSGLTLLTMTNPTRKQTEDDLRKLAGVVELDARERARRQDLMARFLADDADEPLDFARHSLEGARAAVSGRPRVVASDR